MNMNMNMNMAQTAASTSRRGSGFGLNTLQGVPGYGSPRAPPLDSSKSNSLSVPDSPTVAGQTRGRSNSLRVCFYSIYFTVIFIFQF